MTLVAALQAAGAAHLISLSAIVVAPRCVGWSAAMEKLPRLIRQMCNVYSVYTGGTIVACGLVSLLCARELAGGTALARGVCGYIALFWTARLGLQVHYDFRPWLTTAWLRAGYHALTLLFAGFIALYGWVAFAG